MRAFEKSRGYWQTLIDKYGEDIHRWMFGNLEQERFVEMTRAIKSEFKEEAFRSLFQSDGYTPGVKWFAEGESLRSNPRLFEK